MLGALRASFDASVMFWSFFYNYRNLMFASNVLLLLMLLFCIRHMAVTPSTLTCLFIPFFSVLSVFSLALSFNRWDSQNDA